MKTIYYNVADGTYGTTKEHVERANQNVFGFRFTLRDIRRYLVWAGKEVR